MTCPGPRCAVPGPEPCLEHEAGWRALLAWREKLLAVDIKLLARVEWESRGRTDDRTYRHMGLEKGAHLERRYRGEILFALEFSRVGWMPDPYAGNDPGWDFELDVGTVDVKACQWDHTLRVNEPRMMAGRLARFLVVAKVQVKGPDRLAGVISSKRFKDKAERVFNDRWGFFEYRLSHDHLAPMAELVALNVDEFWGYGHLITPFYGETNGQDDSYTYPEGGGPGAKSIPAPDSAGGAGAPAVGDGDDDGGRGDERPGLSGHLWEGENDGLGHGSGHS